MVKLMALYKRPTDVVAFERVYFDEHLPLARKMPGLQRIEINRVTGAPRGEAEYHLIASLYYPDAETMTASLASEESRAAGRTLRDVSAEVTMLLAEVEDA